LGVTALLETDILLPVLFYCYGKGGVVVLFAVGVNRAGYLVVL
jgi:hypothetical protein